MTTKLDVDQGFVDTSTGEAKAYSDENGSFATWDEYLAKLKVRGLRPDGSEIGDPVPMEPPIGYVKPPDLMESIRSMVRSELLRRAAEEEGFESEEEADDFELDDDEVEGQPWDSLTPYEQAELEGMSARRHAEKETAEVMTAEPVPPNPVAGEAGEPAPAGSAAPSHSAATAEPTQVKAPPL